MKDNLDLLQACKMLLKKIKKIVILNLFQNLLLIIAKHLNKFLKTLDSSQKHAGMTAVNKNTMTINYFPTSQITTKN